MIEVMQSQPQTQTQPQTPVINVALVGNPNCGKTSLFNFASGAHGHVGNYSGVTVDASEAHASYYGYNFRLTDLPGTYSLSCYSPEELYVRRHLTHQMPDVVINVIDSSNLERNLYLTTQLIDMDLRMVCALNMYDEFERRGDTVNLDTLSTLFGTPMIPTSFKRGTGINELFKTVIQVYEDSHRHARHIHINYGHEIEHGIKHIQQHLREDDTLNHACYSTRYLAVKLLERDKDIEQFVRKMSNSDEVLEARDMADARVMEEKKTDSETAIMDAKYGFIHGAARGGLYAGHEAGHVPHDALYRRRIVEQILRVPHLLPHPLHHVPYDLHPGSVPHGLD